MCLWKEVTARAVSAVILVIRGTRIHVTTSLKSPLTVGMVNNGSFEGIVEYITGTAFYGPKIYGRW